MFQAGQWAWGALGPESRGDTATIKVSSLRGGVGWLPPASCWETGVTQQPEGNVCLFGVLEKAGLGGGAAQWLAHLGR